MAHQIQKGKKGELLAVAYLLKEGFEMLQVNWRWSYYEIDIIASRENILHFIEVKTRHSKSFGYPEESVSTRKLMNMMNCAEEYQFQYPEWTRIQYDVLSVTILPNEPVEYFFIEDVYL